jgi:hypothetical protein
MGHIMDMNKSSSAPRKITKKSLVGESLRTKLIAGLLITVFAVATIGYFTFSLGIPAMVLTGATIAGQDVKVNEMNYRFYEVFNMYRQYGMISSDKDLDVVVDEATGETYRDSIMDMAAANLQRTKLLYAEAVKNGYVSEDAQLRVDQYIDNLNTFAKEKNTSPDKILASQYGIGMTVRVIKNILLEEYTAEEYAEHLKQTNFNMTSEEIQALFDANPMDYEMATYNAYLFASKVPATETDEKLIAAGKEEAKKNAEAIIADAKDPATFLAACKALDEANAASFADGVDPTIFMDVDYSYAKVIGEDLATFLFEEERAANDTAVIETAAGYYAVLFQSRGIDETPTVSYRVLTVESTDLAAAKTEIEGYKTQVTDEASFISLVKKNSDDAVAYAGGYYAGVTQDTITAESATDHETALYAWLFSPERKSGDMVVINNIDSVSLYYFVKAMPKWQSDLNGENVNTRFEEWYKALAADPANGYTVNMNNIKFATY